MFLVIRRKKEILIQTSLHTAPSFGQPFAYFHSSPHPTAPVHPSQVQARFKRASLGEVPLWAYSSFRFQYFHIVNFNLSITLSAQQGIS